MKEKDTTLLQEELRKSGSLEKFEEENNSELCVQSVADYLNELLIKYNGKKTEITQRAGLDEGYMYQIFNGRRNAKRDKLLQLAFGFPLTIEETQRLLRLGGYGELYVRRKRDTYLMFALEKGYNVQQVNMLLYEKGVELLE
ncbi:MAG: hypothetical protein J6K04_02525 [Lachnospiraceae bacterium]|nr:hypothetical protein [Lachnospiraceae bacterium]